MNEIKWLGRSSEIGYECSSKGDSRFSALFAKMPDGRTIEQWYQCDIKGYDRGGVNWRLGKGKKPKFNFPKEHLWQMYLNLWRVWALYNGPLITELLNNTSKHNNTLKDMFASNDPNSINQARALATILNEWAIPYYKGDLI